MKYNEATDATMVMFMPTSNKKGTYGEMRNKVRHIVGNIYEDEDARNEYGDDLTPENMIVYCRRFTDVERKAVSAAIEEAGMVPLFIEGTTDAFDKCDNNTIVVTDTQNDNED